jgi:hypothetical protein
MKAEVARTFANAKEGVNVRNIIKYMGHPHPKTPLITDNLTTFGIVSGKMKQQQSKAIDMPFYWLKDRESQNQFIIFWVPGKLNLGDYFTKNHTPMHHQNVKRLYRHNNQKSPTHLPGPDAAYTHRATQIRGRQGQRTRIPHKLLSSFHHQGCIHRANYPLQNRPRKKRISIK